MMVCAIVGVPFVCVMHFKYMARYADKIRMRGVQNDIDSYAFGSSQILQLFKY